MNFEFDLNPFFSDGDRKIFLSTPAHQKNRRDEYLAGGANPFQITPWHERVSRKNSKIVYSKKESLYVAEWSRLDGK